MKPGRAFFTLLCCIFVTCIYGDAHLQVRPRPGAKLSYTRVMFEYEKVKGARSYLLQLAEDTGNIATWHYLAEHKDSTLAALITHLHFGKKYKWRYAGIIKGQKIVWNGPYFFEILPESARGQDLVRLEVTKNDAAANAGGLIINDLTSSIYDRNGKLVWFLPPANMAPGSTGSARLFEREVRNLSLTPAGTITYLQADKAVECDLNGNILWRTPETAQVSGALTELYNHDFQRLPDGNYMVLGNTDEGREPLEDLLPANYDSAAMQRRYPQRLKEDDGRQYVEIHYGTVIEYDRQGKVVWSWNSKSYFGREAAVNGRLTSGYEPDAHINSFYVDEKDEFVYLSFRNVSQIIKVEKSTGRVVDSWGEKTATGGAHTAVNFYKQHGAAELKDGNLLTFNNNDYLHKDSFSRVVIFSQQPESDGKILWSFDCNFDTVSTKVPQSHGNADMLANGNIFVCTGSPGLMFEVTPEKKITWQASLQMKDKNAGKPYKLYRAHCIPSLYPCYFTILTATDTVASGRPNFVVRIDNHGTERDKYEIKLLSVTGSLIQVFSTGTVAPNSSLNYKVKPGTPGDFTGPLYIEICSEANPAFIRRAAVEVVNKSSL